MKPLIVVGKGPHVETVSKNADYHVLAINSAVRMCEAVDYLLVNDSETFGDISPGELNRCRSLIVPTHLHVQQGHHLIPWYQGVPAKHPPLYFYALHTEPAAARRKNRPPIPHFGTIFSGAEAAVAWALHRRYRRFVFNGIGPEPGYHPTFGGDSQDTHKPPEWYRTNWSRILARLNEAGASFNPDSTASTESTK